MCLIKQHGVGGVFEYTIHGITCDRCGATENWPEINERHKFQVIRHHYLENYGLVDEVKPVDHKYVCPGCHGEITEHWIDCRRDGVGNAVLSGVSHNSNRDIFLFPEKGRGVGVPSGFHGGRALPCDITARHELP